MRPKNPTPFTRQMYELCKVAPKRVKGYYPGDFYKALENAGDDFAPRARQFLAERLQPGLERLAQGRALDISMEWSIAFGGWPEFSPADRKAAHDRLVLVSEMYGLPSPPSLSKAPTDTPLQWTDRLVPLFEASMKRGEVRDGYASAFVPLDSSTGVKLFPNAEWRDYAMNKQKIAHANGLAPDSGSPFEIPAALCKSEKLTWKHRGESSPRTFGYMTERADTALPPSAAEMQAVIRQLIAVAELDAPPENAFEDSIDNFGRLHGRWVYIDFDEGTWSQ